ncbi:MAG: hypothetical protein KKB81_07745 [Candidatus Margulisbacteria bacterium]|nr:hypothetical protein [Candidatus Margulisiibacteriota bacterium]MBU1021242.1 hypothetical protein [Candidatus Margulisiibacteriota bacterium]MBU1729847.1 hypothetical protein [Candidatus Margulisiibacteriota bacterium]MBU1768013.1 hypothetical protein [Candidatus Omnitrophota bacterium]MBU1955348.1 hypothetical protein [Candidatus Margulisiibacteriota bacterium]
MIRPKALISRFNRVEVRTARQEIFRFELNFCVYSRKYFLTCHIGRLTVGHLDFSAERDGGWISVTDACFNLSSAACYSDYICSTSDPALEVNSAFRRRNIAHALFSVLAQWGRQQCFAGIRVPEKYAQPLRDLDKLGFNLTGGNWEFDFHRNLDPALFIK